MAGTGLYLKVPHLRAEAARKTRKEVHLLPVLGNLMPWGKVSESQATSL